jgi:ABC-type Fe3+/spermidine/putrescine transport system ATPase subunit
MRDASPVRPEQVALRGFTDAEEPNLNHVVGTVETVVFLGESTTCLVRVDDTVMRVKQFHDAAHRGTSEGVQVMLTWSPGDTSAFVVD